MKKFLIILLSLFSLCSLTAQQRVQRSNLVNINLIGNKNVQVAIDGTTYNMATTTASKSSVAINNLAVGMHTLTLTKSKNNNNNNNNRNNVTTQFNLRRNFDMTINLNANGSLELIETRKSAGTTTSSSTRTAMTDAAFYNLSKSVRAQRTSDSRYTLLTNTFNNTSTNMSSKQVTELLRQVSTESQRLQLAKLSYRSVVDPNNFYQVVNLFTSQASRDDLEDHVYLFDEDGTVVTNPIPTPNTSLAMSDAAFNSLYNTIRGQYPVTTQVNSIHSTFTNTTNYFTAYQAGRLIQLVSNESYRLQLAKASYRAVVDPSNFYTIRDLLYSQASRTELEAYVSGGQPGTGATTTRTPMGDADYNNLYESINSQFLPFAQMTSLTNAFNNTAFYFTTAQAKKLILLVSSETNRLQLSKQVYRNIVDRANFTQMYELFTSQSYVNDLNAYVQAYRD